MFATLAVRRLGQALLVFVGASFLVFAMVWLLPGDEIRALFGLSQPEPEALAELRAVYHMDDPFLLQYLRYLGGVLHGDLGPLYRLGMDGQAVQTAAVNAVVAQTVAPTLRILVVAVVVELLVAVPVGIAVGRRPGSGWDAATTAACVLMVAVPPFVVAAIAHVLAVQLLGAAYTSASGWPDALLPGVVVALAPTALIVRVLRDHTRVLARAPWVSTLRAGGVPEPRISWRYGGRTALAVGITLVAAEVGPTLTGLLIVERVFGIPGLGNTLLEAVRSQQGPLVVGAVVTFVGLVVAATFLADLAVMVLHPRTR